MSAVIRIIKRADKADADTAPAAVESRLRSANSEIVSTVKYWIAESRERRQAQAKLAVQFIRGLDVKSGV